MEIISLLKRPDITLKRPYSHQRLWLLPLVFLIAACNPDRSSDFNPEELTPSLKLKADADTNTTRASLTLRSPGGTLIRITNGDYYSLTRGDTTRILYRRSSPLEYNTEFDGAGKQSYTLKFNRRGQLDFTELFQIVNVPSTPELIYNANGAQLTINDAINFSWQSGDATEQPTLLSIIPTVEACVSTNGAMLSSDDVFGNDGLSEPQLDLSDSTFAAGNTISIPSDQLFSAIAIQSQNVVSCDARLQISVAFDAGIQSLSQSVSLVLMGEAP